MILASVIWLENVENSGVRNRLTVTKTHYISWGPRFARDRQKPPSVSNGQE